MKDNLSHLTPGSAIKKLSPYPVERILVTDSLPVPAEKSLPIRIVGIGKRIADRIEAISIEH